MLQDETSIKRQLHRDRVLIPPYCPNAKCPFHLKRGEPFFRRHGNYKLKRFPYTSTRFICKHCNRSFTVSFFKLYYRQKIWGQNETIFNLHILGVSKRETARQINHSEHLVRIRFLKLARWALIAHAKRSENLMISEPIVYDGLENFSFSQYDPNNLNHAVGKNSLFIYDFNLAPINRKGRMSIRQKARLRFLDEKFGRYPSDAIRSTTTKIFQRLSAKANGALTLYSDRHFQYERSVKFDLSERKIEHIRVSSKIARNFKNHLFAVNNIDLQARHNLACFKRETIAFSKHSIAMLEGFVLYAIYRNYMRPKFWGTHRSDPLSCKNSPDMELRLTDSIFQFKDFFRERVCLSQVRLHGDWQHLHDRIDPYSRQVIATSATI